MDGESAINVNAEVEDTGNFATIPLMLTFDEPETASPMNADNDEPEVKTESEPQQEPAAVSALASVDTGVTTLIAVRLGSGADDNPTTAAGDVEAENMDNRGRRSQTSGRRSRSRGFRSRSRGRRNRSRGRQNRSRGRQNRSRGRSNQSHRSRSRSNSSDFSVVVQITDDEMVPGNSRGGQKVIRGGRRGGKTTRGSHISKNVTYASRDGRKPVRGRKPARGRKSGRGRKTAAASMQPRTLWSDRLRSRKTYRNKKSAK